MPAGNAVKLYNSVILGLAVELSEYPYDPAANLLGTARSRSCGSTLDASLVLREDSSVGSVGLRVTACAIGQASAVIFAKDAIGRSLQDLQRSFKDIESWLSSNSTAPIWRDIQILNEARDYPARHDAMLLPWKAAIDALSNGKAPS